MRNFGLIGKTLKHSFSKNYFTNKFEVLSIEDTQYELYELTSISEFPALINSMKFAGLNVTIPYKEEVIPFLQELDEVAEGIGAVNTIHFTESGLKGYNTDVIGFTHAIRKLIGRKKVEQALVLGTGGASKAILYSLAKMGIEAKTVSRTKGDFSYEEIDKTIMKEHRLIVNCTPLGTYPNIDEAPILPYKFLNKKHLLFDLVYNPEKSLFLKYGEEKSCSTMNGLSMLVGQAEASWQIWTNP